MADNLPDNIESTLEKEAGIVSNKKRKKQAEDRDPVYRVMGDSKIPVSKHRGKLWLSRRNNGIKSQDSFIKAFDEANCYYRNDHSGKQRAKKSAANRITAHDDIYTENIVYANTKVLIPIVYARDPVIEITEEDRDPKTNSIKAKRATVAERLVNKIFTMRTAPGINLKPKARRGILSVLLSNSAFAVIGFNEKINSSEYALEDLRKIGQELEDAKSTKEIESAEGKLLAIEKKIDSLSPSGFTLKIKTIKEVIIDPDHNEPDRSDANWMMYCDYMSTDYLNAEFGKDKEGKIVSVYEPTHVLDARSSGDTSESIEQEVNNFVLFKESSRGNAFGYDDDESFDKAKRTKIWWVWDKITRRLELYADNNWKFPIWVWDDPFELEEFFPIYDLCFNIDVEA